MKSKFSFFLDACAAKMGRSEGSFYQRRIKAAAAIDQLKTYYTKQLEELNNLTAKPDSIIRSWEQS